MRVLTVNAGSTSLKVESYDLPSRLPPIAEPPAARNDREGIDVVAHRFVRLPEGAPPLLPLDEAALAAIGLVAGEAPLHDAPALRAVAQLRDEHPGIPQYAVSDSAFHRTLSDAAATYALPREIGARGLRRRGFHGLSHEYAAHRGAALAGLDVTRARIVTLHLGGGSSLCAIDGGRSVDTTMGYTPLEGIPMATRSGSVDPGLLIRLLRDGTSVDELETMLERRSGLLGLSGRSGDVRDLLAAGDDPAARLALDVLAWRTRAALGAMIGVLGGVDLVVFTGGIGEHAAPVRAAVLAGAGGWGGALDPERNRALRGEGAISPAGARVGCCVVAARENWMLARAVAAIA